MAVTAVKDMAVQRGRVALEVMVFGILTGPMEKKVPLNLVIKNIPIDKYSSIQQIHSKGGTLR